MSGIKNFLNNFIEDDDNETEVSENYETEKTSEYEKACNSDIRTATNAKMIVKEPRSYDDAKEVAQYLLAGKAVIVISSEMPEIIGTCDRAYVINEGEIAGELSGEEITQERIMQHIMAHNRKGEN